MRARTRVLVAGASGTVGRRLCLALLHRGYAVTGVARHLPEELVAAGVRPIHADVRDWDCARWALVVADVDVAINAVGIFRESDQQRFADLHERLPRSLFSACEEGKVRLAIQISALGADAEATSGYHRTKRNADEWLLAQAIPAVVVQPSLIFSVDGPSAQLFLGLASAPVQVLPEGGRQAVQPIHVDDVADAIAGLLDNPARWVDRRIALVGPSPLSLKAYLQALRRSLGQGPSPTLSLPAWLAEWGSRFIGAWPGSLISADSLRMLRRGNVADASDTFALLGRAPRGAQEFVEASVAPAVRWRSQWAWLSWVLRLSLAFIWLLTAWVSLFVYPVADSLMLLAAVGVPDRIAPVALWGASLLDLGLGVATLLARRAWRRRVWWSQVTLVLFYTMVLTVFLPQFWWHPYGPLSKNAAVLALLAVLIAADATSDTRR